LDAGGADSFGDVGVDFGGFDIGVAKQFLDGADVFSGFEQVGGEGVAEGVGSDPFGDIRQLDGATKRVAVAAGMDVMAPEGAGFRIS
jgi:hypothetical protein